MIKGIQGFAQVYTWRMENDDSAAEFWIERCAKLYVWNSFFEIRL